MKPLLSLLYDAHQSVVAIAIQHQPPRAWHRIHTQTWLLCRDERDGRDTSKSLSEIGARETSPPETTAYHQTDSEGGAQISYRQACETKQRCHTTRPDQATGSEPETNRNGREEKLRSIPRELSKPIPCCTACISRTTIARVAIGRAPQQWDPLIVRCSRADDRVAATISSVHDRACSAPV